MDTARRVVAILLMVTSPSAIGYWFVIHPFTRFWRRVGVIPTYVIVGTGMIASFVLLYRFRDPLLGRDFGTRWALVVPGITLYGLAIVLEIRLRKHLTFRTLAGVPELAQEAGEGKLLDQGIYARVRHPRYVAFLIAIAGFALFSNFAGMYVLAVLCVPAILLVARIEERELANRFGDRYLDYRKRVPAFFPRPRT
jgi:protein-S-isoprenylcysteine O-methyltransferase Ste14